MPSFADYFYFSTGPRLGGEEDYILGSFKDSIGLDFQESRRAKERSQGSSYMEVGYEPGRKTSQREGSSKMQEITLTVNILRGSSLDFMF